MSAGTTARQAIALVRPGARVYVASLLGTPVALLEALAASGIADVELFYFILSGVDPRALAARAPGLRLRPIYIGEPLTPTAFGDSCSYIPLSLPQAARLVRAGRLTFDVALTAAGAVDGDGLIGLGGAVGMTDAVLDSGVLAIAESVAAMPEVPGAPRYPAGRFAAVVASDRALPEYVHPRNDASAQRIGRYLAHLIADGSTLQIGPGRVANGALRFLGERRRLRVLTDVLYEEAITLIEAGALDRTSDPPITASHVNGTAAAFRIFDHHPLVCLRGIEAVAAQAEGGTIPRLVALTQAFAVDLGGQACCEAYEGQWLGGLAAQPEFMRGAARSPGGKPILCLYATDPSGRSAIRAQLGPAEPVTIARSDVHCVVTEHGIAYLHGKSLQDRALALIEIAAPAARAELLAQARELGLVARDYQRLNEDAYAIEDERVVVSRDGREVRIRPARLRDAPAMQRLLHQLPEEDVYLRFFRYLRTLTTAEAVRLCTGVQGLDAVFVATVGEREAEQVIASACLFGEPTTRLGEVGYLVDRQWQGQGLGRHLQQALIDKARALGMRGLSAQILADNQRMLALARASGLSIALERDGETCDVVMAF